MHEYKQVTLLTTHLTYLLLSRYYNLMREKPARTQQTIHIGQAMQLMLIFYNITSNVSSNKFKYRSPLALQSH